MVSASVSDESSITWKSPYKLGVDNLDQDKCCCQKPPDPDCDNEHCKCELTSFGDIYSPGHPEALLPETTWFFNVTSISDLPVKLELSRQKITNLGDSTIKIGCNNIDQSNWTIINDAYLDENNIAALPQKNCHSVGIEFSTSAEDCGEPFQVPFHSSVIQPICCCQNPPVPCEFDCVCTFAQSEGMLLSPGYPFKAPVGTQIFWDYYIVGDHVDTISKVEISKKLIPSLGSYYIVVGHADEPNMVDWDDLIRKNDIDDLNDLSKKLPSSYNGQKIWVRFRAPPTTAVTEAFRMPFTIQNKITTQAPTTTTGKPVKKSHCLSPCTLEMTGEYGNTTGTIRSPNFPQPYDPDMKCECYIYGSPKSIIKLQAHPEEFFLDEASTIKIGDGEELKEESVIHEFKGPLEQVTETYYSEEIDSPNPAMWLLFSSQDSFSEEGKFELQFEYVELDDDVIEMKKSSGVIEIKGDYPVNFRRTWLITVNARYQIEMKIDYADIDVTASDYLVIGPGHKKFLGAEGFIVTGVVEESDDIIRFVHNKAYLFFVSNNHINNRQGFRLQYKQYGNGTITTPMPTTTSDVPIITEYPVDMSYVLFVNLLQVPHYFFNNWTIWNDYQNEFINITIESANLWVDNQQVERFRYIMTDDITAEPYQCDKRCPLNIMDQCIKLKIQIIVPELKHAFYLTGEEIKEILEKYKDSYSNVTDAYGIKWDYNVDCVDDNWLWGALFITVITLGLLAILWNMKWLNWYRRSKLHLKADEQFEAPPPPEPEKPRMTMGNIFSIKPDNKTGSQSNLMFDPDKDEIVFESTQEERAERLFGGYDNGDLPGHQGFPIQMPNADQPQKPIYHAKLNIRNNSETAL